MEVNAAERAAFEIGREEWVRPPQSFIDMWNKACVGHEDNYTGDYANLAKVWGAYNEKTGYFELNGLTDITYAQAINIYNIGYPDINKAFEFNAAYVRTNLPPQSQQDMKASKTELFDLSPVEAINITPSYGNFFAKSSGYPITFGRISSVKRIIGKVVVSGNANANKWVVRAAGKLEDITLQVSDDKINLNTMPKMNYNSYQLLVANCKAAMLEVVTHTDIYAALTGDAVSYPFNGGSKEEWAQLLEDAMAKNITFTT